MQSLAKSLPPKYRRSALNLPNAYRQKLAPIQTLTQQDDQTAILTAIDLDYTQLTQAPDPLARLKASKLIGSFNGDPDLSEQSEILFREHIGYLISNNNSGLI